MSTGWYASIAAAAVAAILGYCAPHALAAVPEPAEAPDDKRTYRELAAVRGLRIAIAAVSLIGVFVLAGRIRPGGLIVWAFFVPFGGLLSYLDWHTRLLPHRLLIPGRFTRGAP